MWMRSNLGKVLTLFQISTLFRAAFIRACTVQSALNGFKKTGTWTPDKTVFTDDDFLPSATTDIQLNDLRTNNNQVTNEEIDYRNTGIEHSIVTDNETSVLNDKSTSNLS
ncbi:hypothetical protein Trydic_g17011 [Trypoxylus dichotomus]